MAENNIFKRLEEHINSSVNIPENEKSAILMNIMRAREQQVNILIAGATGCGKSSTINALFGVEKASVGVGTDPETMNIERYDLDNMTLWDSPGLGDGKEQDKAHSRIITDLLNRKNKDGSALIDMVLVIIDGGTRDIGTTYELIEKVLLPALGEERSDRLLVAINQADMAMKGRYWNREQNSPEPELVAFLEEKAASVKRRIFESTGVEIEPIYYSAGFKEEGMPQEPPYNLSKLLYYMLRCIPQKKRLVVADRINTEVEVWQHDDKLVNYHEEIGYTLAESIVEGAELGADAGEVIGSFFGEGGRKVGRAVGTVLGAIAGFFCGLFS